MKVITKYKANDGREFTDQSKCEEYEFNCFKSESIMTRLKKTPDTCEFTNGSGFIQQDLKVVAIVRKDLLIQAEKEHHHKWFQQSIDDPSIDPSWAYRIISECCTNALSKAWCRIYCIDSDGREWGQPYYRTHQEEATQKEL